MKNKLNSKMFRNNLKFIEEFMQNELNNLKNLKKISIDNYRSRVAELSRYGFVIHHSQFTSEPMDISFGGIGIV